MPHLGGEPMRGLQGLLRFFGQALRVHREGPPDGCDSDRGKPSADKRRLRGFVQTRIRDNLRNLRFILDVVKLAQSGCRAVGGQRDSSPEA
jgi:hypothetical protein